MKLKKTIIIITLLILSFGVIGCSKLQVGENSSEEYNFDKIKLNKDNIFAFGIEQTKNIENVVKKYGITTTHNVAESEKAEMIFLDDEKGIYDGDKGYIISTPKTVRINDGGENCYDVGFSARIKADNKVFSDILIQIECPVTQEFKLDNFMMFKEVLEEIYSNEFDLIKLESSIKDLIAKVPSGEEKHGPKVLVGDFLQTIAFHNNKDGKNKLIFFLVKSWS